MAKVFILHWHEAELAEWVAPFEHAGHEVRSHGSTDSVAKWGVTDSPTSSGDWLPDIVVLSLERLPSHSRAYAEWIVEAKKRQSIPLLFAGGKPEKVADTKKKFPRASYCKAGDALRIATKLLDER